LIDRAPSGALLFSGDAIFGGSDFPQIQIFHRIRFSAEPIGRIAAGAPLRAFVPRRGAAAPRRAAREAQHAQAH
jgi:hypothetical protein